MSKKIYVVVEALQDYKGAYSTVWGARETADGAKELLKESVIAVSGCESEEEENEVFNNGVAENGKSWTRDDCDLYQHFEIEEIELN